MSLVSMRGHTVLVCVCRQAVSQGLAFSSDDIGCFEDVKTSRLFQKKTSSSSMTKAVSTWIRTRAASPSNVLSFSGSCGTAISHRAYHLRSQGELYPGVDCYFAVGARWQLRRGRHAGGTSGTSFLITLRKCSGRLGALAISSPMAEQKGAVNQ